MKILGFVSISVLSVLAFSALSPTRAAAAGHASGLPPFINGCVGSLAEHSATVSALGLDIPVALKVSFSDASWHGVILPFSDSAPQPGFWLIDNQSIMKYVYEKTADLSNGSVVSVAGAPHFFHLRADVHTIHGGRSWLLDYKQIRLLKGANSGQVIIAPQLTEVRPVNDPSDDLIMQIKQTTDLATNYVRRLDAQNLIGKDMVNSWYAARAACVIYVEVRRREPNLPVAKKPSPEIRSNTYSASKSASNSPSNLTSKSVPTQQPVQSSSQGSGQASTEDPGLTSTIDVSSESKPEAKIESQAVSKANSSSNSGIDELDNSP